MREFPESDSIIAELYRTGFSHDYRDNHRSCIMAVFVYNLYVFRIYTFVFKNIYFEKDFKRNFKTTRKRIEPPTSTLVAQRLYQLSHAAVSSSHDYQGNHHSCIIALFVYNLYILEFIRFCSKIVLKRLWN